MTISAIVVAYHAGAALEACVRSLETEADEVVVVDNGSGPELAAVAATPGVRVVDPGGNVGYASGCNRGAAAASGDVLVFLNPDVVASPGALARLAAALADPELGAVMPRIRLAAEPDRLNTTGNTVHVSGIASVEGYGEPLAALPASRDVPYASGTALAIRRSTLEEVGGFADELFLYQEDLELCWRLRLRGYRIGLVADADVTHDYEFSRHVGKWYYLERNRAVFVLSAYSLRLLLVLAPLLLATELAVVLYAVRYRWLQRKLAGWAWCLRHARTIHRRRRATQRLRRVPDRVLGDNLTATFTPTVIAAPAVLRVVNPLVRGYWSLAKRAL